MCPTPVGRIHTRTAIIWGPAIVGLIVSLWTGNWGWLALVGLYLLEGVFLDSAVYPWLLRYQPPWVALMLAIGELGILLVISNALEIPGGDASVWEAIVFYWVVWPIAALTKIVVLPIVSLTYLESAGEIRSTEWSIPAGNVPVPVLASATEAQAGPGPLIREASGVHAKPLPQLPSPSGLHQVPQQAG